MTTLQERPGSALIVIDVQNDVMADAHERDRVVAVIATLVKRARAESVPIVWIQHADADMVHGSAGWQVVVELTQEVGEPIVHKTFGDAFEDTALESILAELTVGRLVMVGAHTDACVRSTLHGAFVRGYDVTLVTDAHTTEDLSAWGAPTPAAVIAHTNLYWGFQRAPGRVAEAVAAADVRLSH